MTRSILRHMLWRMTDPILPSSLGNGDTIEYIARDGSIHGGMVVGTHPAECSSCRAEGCALLHDMSRLIDSCAADLKIKVFCRAADRKPKAEVAPSEPAPIASSATPTNIISVPITVHKIKDRGTVQCPQPVCACDQCVEYLPRPKIYSVRMVGVKIAEVLRDESFGWEWHDLYHSITLPTTADEDAMIDAIHVAMKSTPAQRKASGLSW